MNTIERLSPCKVNLLLNILGKRVDGFHELETVMHPVNLFDRLVFEKQPQGVNLSCDVPSLPTDSSNLVRRAATAFLESAAIREGVKIRLEKHIPMAAGLGGGSGNAATTLLAMNELFGAPLDAAAINSLAAGLGSDVPFFLQRRPALATGRGEKVLPLDPFPAMQGLAILLIHPGFGIATAWAYRELSQFPHVLRGRPGRAAELISLLQTADMARAGQALFNSLEAPALYKYPVLALYQQFLKENGALGALMSGSGSTTFAIVAGQSEGEALAARFKEKFGSLCWTAVAPVSNS